MSIGGNNPFRPTGAPGPLSTPTHNPAQPLNTSLPTAAGTVDTFGASAPLTPAQQQWTATLNAYQDKVLGILGSDAVRLANGATPLSAGGQLTDAQEKELQDATTDLLVNMPVGVLAPDAHQWLRDRGVQVPDLNTTRLKDLGQVGGDLARDLAARIKKSDPLLYWGVAGAAAVALGVVAYTRGSEALTRLGIKPEFKTKIFNDHVTLRAKGAWEERLRNPTMSVGADANFRVRDAMLGVGATVNMGGSTVGGMGVRSVDLDARATVPVGNRGGSVAAEAGVSVDGDGAVTGGHGQVRWEQPGASVTGRVDLGPGGDPTRYSLSGEVTRDALTLRGNGALDGNGRPALAGLGGTYTRDAFNLSAGVEHDFVADRTTGTLSAGYRPQRDLEIAVRGSLDSRGESRVGVGLVWHF